MYIHSLATSRRGNCHSRHTSAFLACTGSSIARCRMTEKHCTLVAAITSLSAFLWVWAPQMTSSFPTSQIKHTKNILFSVCKHLHCGQAYKMLSAVLQYECNQKKRLEAPLLFVPLLHLPHKCMNASGASDLHLPPAEVAAAAAAAAATSCPLLPAQTWHG